MARKRRYKKRLKFKLRGRTVTSIIAVVVFFAGAVSLISLLGSVTGVDNALSQFLASIFGYVAIMVPFLLMSLGLYLARFKWEIARPRIIIGLGVTLTGLATLLHVFYLNNGSHMAALGKGGGYLGNTSATYLANIISPPGAFIVGLMVFIVGILLMFNTSLESIGKRFAPLQGLLDDFSKALQQRKEARAKQRSEAEKTAAQTQKDASETSFKVYGDEAAIEEKSATSDPKTDKSVETAKPAVHHTKDQQADVVVSKPGILAKTTDADDSDKPLETTGFDPKLWQYPPLTLLNDKPGVKADRGNVKEKAGIIEKTLSSFGIKAQVVEVNLGPAVTQYALDISEGTKISKITSLQNDIALALAAPTGMVRIEAPIPGKSLVGIEVPNYSPSMVTLKSMLTSTVMENARSKLTVGLGHDVAGQPVVADIARMPHVLVAGTTGSGKSVMLNSFIVNLLYRAHPGEVKMIMVDPKRVELIQYQDIPHLLTPVIVDAEKVLSALKWAVNEMQKRYRIFEQERVKNIDGYNQKMGQIIMPYIVLIIDEMADLMMYAPTEVEAAICRLAQLSRATGIHLVLATQRPSVDVITGLIKANIPCRVAFNVSSGTDSRVILDQPGAEKLLGRGDMLYLPPDASKPMRIQGVYSSDIEISQIIQFIKEKNAVKPEYHEEIVEYSSTKLSTGGEPEDELFNEAVGIICNYDRASASLLQRRLRIGYARAARLLDELEERGVIGPKDGSKPREVLVRSAEEFFGHDDEVDGVETHENGR